MDNLYRIFYVMFSMSIMAAVVFPVILVLRFLIKKLSSRAALWLWGLFFLRAVCPASLSSPLCLTEKWNRSYHYFLSQIGLSFQPEQTLMTDLKEVATSEVSATKSYMLCAVFWAVCVVGLWLMTVLRQRSVCSILGNAKQLDKRTYQCKGLPVPMILGVFFSEIYVSEETTALEAKYIFRHMQTHIARHDPFWRFVAYVIVSLHWFNPCLWLAFYLMKKDQETACDEMVWHSFEGDEHKMYAQQLLNMQRGTGSARGSLLTFQEEDCRKRALAMLYHRPERKSDRGLAGLVLFLLFVWLFLLRPLQLLWNGGTWQQEVVEQEKEPLFSDKPIGEVAASVVTVSPEGLERTVQLVMTEGDSSDKAGWSGSFSLVMTDSFEQVLWQQEIMPVFAEALLEDECLKITQEDLVEHLSFTVPEGAVLCAGDYNADGVQEISVGAALSLTKKQWKRIAGKKRKKKDKETPANIYLLWEVGSQECRVCSEPLYMTERTGTESVSAVMEMPEETTGILQTAFAGQTRYYEWDEAVSAYVYRELTEEELYQKQTQEPVQEKLHTLEKDGQTVVQVKTAADESGSEEIQSVVLKPEGLAVTFDDINGYYCNLVWAPMQDESTGRYALLTYNGVQSQTFVIYDVKAKEIFYQHEDGNGILGELFAQYNGETIRFEDGEAAVYSLGIIDGERLRINFAANAADGVTVNGNYWYDRKTTRMSELTYSQ